METETPKIPIYLLDGGLGTTLADHYDCIFNDTTPLWSSQLLLTSPETLLRAQMQFALGGADIILTATYQASYEGFERSGVEEEDAEEAMRWGVSLARKAFETVRKEKGKVALSLGAYGATMMPSQEYSGKYDADHVMREQLREWHKRRLEVFSGSEDCWGKVDIVAFETLPVREEILAVREVMDGLGKGSERGFWISCVFPGQGNVLPDGSSVKEVVDAMLERREGARSPMGVGINCTKVGKVEGLIEEFEGAIGELVENGEVDEWPSLVVYPDGTKGEVYNTTIKEWEKVDEELKDSVRITIDSDFEVERIVWRSS
jgi:homocysteine S-methyltransferase